MVKPLHEIEKQQCVEAGVLTKIHGIHGELILSLNQEFTGDIEEMELIFIEIDEGLVPFFIDVDSTRYKNDRQVILKLDDVATTEETTELLNCSVFIPKTTTQNNDAPALNLSSIEGFR